MPLRSTELLVNLALWLAGVAFVYGVMFATGGLIFHEPRQASVSGGIALVAGALLFAGLRRSEPAPG